MGVGKVGGWGWGVGQERSEKATVLLYNWPNITDSSGY